MGHNNYYPDFTGSSPRTDNNRGQVAHQHNVGQQNTPQPHNAAQPQATTNQGGTP